MRSDCTTRSAPPGSFVGACLGAVLVCVGGQAAAADEKAPAPAPPAASEAPLVTPYGIIKPEFIIANGVETFGKTTMVAPTAAAHPIANPLNDELASSIQLQQTRFGLWVGKGGPLSARAEIDFVDPAFSQSSPIQGSRLRLRLAYITYQVSPGHTLTMGQNWDIFSPLNPATMNMVGVAYQAGNSAFLRPQLRYTYSGGGLEVSASVGTQRQNTGPSLNGVEYALIPAFALQVGYKQGKTWLGVSAIGTNQMTVLPPDSESEPAYGVNAFASLALSDSIGLTAEAYFGENLNGLGALTLSGVGIQDAGGWLSATIKLAEKQALWVLAGAAFVLNKDELGLGYTAGTPDSRAGIGGIESNVSLRATYVVTPMKGLELYLEPFLFLTRHKLDPADDPNDSEADRKGFGTQVGSRFKF